MIFTFEGVDYRRLNGQPLDLSQVKFRGQDPLSYSNQAQTVSYPLTVTGGELYTISQDDFDWPPDHKTAHDVLTYVNNSPCWPYVRAKWFSGTYAEDTKWLSWGNFHNCNFRIYGRTFACANQTFTLAYSPKTARVTWSIVPGSDTTGGATINAITGEVTTGPNAGQILNGQFIPNKFTVKAVDRLTDCENTHEITLLEGAQSVGPPAGGEDRPWLYNRLTNAEIDKLAQSLPPVWPSGIPMSMYSDFAVRAVFGARIGFSGRPSNETCVDCIQNAVQHAYWNWLLASKFGVDRAKALTDAHEDWLGNPCNDKGMDLSNNLAGQDLYRNNSKDGQPTISDDMALAMLVQMARDGLLSANTPPR